MKKRFKRTPLDILRQRHANALRQAEAAEERAALLRDRAAGYAKQIIALGKPLYGDNAPKIPRCPPGSNKIAFEIVREHGFVTSLMLAERVAAKMGRPACYVMRQRASQCLMNMERRGTLADGGSVALGPICTVKKWVLGSRGIRG